MWNYNDPNKDKNVVIFDRGENTQCTINLHGCNVTSWRFENWEQLFVSRHSHYDKCKQIVGGVAIDFPKIGRWAFGPENGFARISQWELIKGPFVNRKTEDVQGVFRLVDNPHTRSFWNFNFEITITITLGEKTLDFHTKIKNTSPNMPMRYNYMIPVFLQIPKVEKIQIFGLKNYIYYDQALQDEMIYRDKRKSFDIDEFTYRMYEDGPKHFEIQHVHNDYTMKFHSDRDNDIIIWNPWKEHGGDVDDFRAEQYKDMIFVGLGNIAKDVRLVPGAENETHFQLEIKTKEGLCTLLY